MTHAPSAAELVWKRLREQVPERTGVLILDGRAFRTGAGLGRRRAAVPRRPRQGRELSDGGHGGAVDRGAGVAAGRHAAPPRGAADATPTRTGTDSRGGSVRAEMAVRLDAAAPGPLRERFTSPPWSAMRSWQQRDAASRVHRAPVALCVGDVRPIFKVFLGTPVLEAPAPLTGKGRPRTRRRVAAADAHHRSARVGGHANAATVATRLVRATVRTPRGAPASVHPVTPAHDWRAEHDSRPKSGCSANANWRAATASATTWSIPAHRLVARPGPSRPSALAIGTACRTQGRTRTRSLRRPQPAGLATPRRPHSDRLQLLQHERRRRRQTTLTLPQVRAVIQRCRTAHFS